MSSFKKFAKQVNSNFNELTKTGLYKVNVDPEELWSMYLNSFPVGTNNIYLSNTEHDCNCCKAFIKNVGNVVSIVDGNLKTVWKCSELDFPYNTVADILDTYVKNKDIKDVASFSEPLYGKELTVQKGTGINWNHFYSSIPSKYINNPSRVDDFNSLYKTLVKFKVDYVDQVLSLIESNNLYRGSEFKNSLLVFKEVLQKTKATVYSYNFMWATIVNTPYVCSFKNSVIGTLIEDLSDNVPLDIAVTKFESKVAPSNYKRTTALITQKQIEDAQAFLEASNMLGGITRTTATLEDISVNDILWADYNSKTSLKAVDLLGIKPTKNTVATVTGDKISVNLFVGTILPKVKELEILNANTLQHRKMALTKGTDLGTDSNSIFAWENNFGWSYEGNVTDGIKERVKAAGGKVDSLLRVSLSWNNADDLDLSATVGKNTVYFGRKQNTFMGATLDVDMHVSIANLVDCPVENIYFDKIVEGTYSIEVNNYTRRSTANVGFTVQIEYKNNTYNLQCNTNNVYKREVVKFKFVKGEIVIMPNNEMEIITSDKSNNTLSKYPISLVMNSPNYWESGNGKGNVHWFFITKECVLDKPVRGFYTEFLVQELHPYRKVMEQIANNTLLPISVDCLGGFGFTRDSEESLVVMATNLDGTKKQYEISFKN